MTYYRLFGKEDKKMGIAYVPENTPLNPVPFTGWVNNWQTMTLDLREGEYRDYLANNRAFKLCSTRLKDILDSSKSDKDTIQWLSVIVHSENGEEKDYFIMHIYKEHNVLDRDRTMYGAYNSVIRPVVSNKLAEGHHIFTYPESMGVSYFVSDQVRRKIMTGKCSGVTFERTAAVD